jgi:FtsH-binding integral membrane protein
MADNFNSNYNPSVAKTQAEIDEGLRSYMLTVYNYMAAALALTGLMAYVTANTPTLFELFYTFAQYPDGSIGITGRTIMGWVVMLAPLGMVFFLSARIASMKASTAQMVFWIFAGLMGVSLSSVLFQYTGASVTKTFFVTSAAFAGLSLFGYTTKKNLTGMGSFLIMGVWGLFIAMIVNMFMQSSTMDFIISGLGVLIFAGLTAYDTQKIKLMYLEADGSETMSKKAIMGALNLYLDFINMFLFLLRFMGSRD